jgi:hypothetical protein
MTALVGIMTIVVMSDTHCIRDIGAGGISNHAADDRAHGTSDQQSRTGAHGAIAESLLRYRAHRGESDSDGNCRNSQLSFHDFLPSNEDVMSLQRVSG